MLDEARRLFGNEEKFNTSVSLNWNLNLSYFEAFYKFSLRYVADCRRDQAAQDARNYRQELSAPAHGQIAVRDDRRAHSHQHPRGGRETAQRIQDFRHE